MELKLRIGVLVGLLATTLGASAAMAFPVCAQNGGVTVCNDNGVVTVCSGSGGVGICTDSNGNTNIGTKQGNTNIVTGSGGTHVWQDPPQPRYDDRDRWDHRRHGGGWGQRRGGWGHHDRDDRWQPSVPDTTPSYPDTTPSYPDTTPSYPDTTPSYPDTSGSSSVSTVARLCVGTYSGKFVSGEKAALQFLADGSIYLRARGRVFPARGTCVLVSNKRADFSIVLNDDDAYGFIGTINKSANGTKTLTAKQTKNGRAIDRLALSSKR